MWKRFIFVIFSVGKQKCIGDDDDDNRIAMLIELHIGLGIVGLGIFLLRHRFGGVRRLVRARPICCCRCCVIF